MHWWVPHVLPLFFLVRLFQTKKKSWCVFLFSFSGVGQKDTKKVTAPDVPIREFQKNDMFQFESFRKPTAPDVPTVFFSSV